MSGGTWSRLTLDGGHDLLISLFELDSLDFLLVFNLFFHVLVSLKELVVLGFSELQSFIEVALELLFERVHLVLLLLDELGLCSDDLLMSLLHVLFPLLAFQVLAFNLGFMRLLIILLFAEIGLDLLLVQKFGAIFEGEWESFLEDLSVFLNLLSVSIFKLSQGLSVFLLGLQKILVPLLVEFLILLDVRLLTFLLLLSLIEDQLFRQPVVLLNLEFLDSFLCHLSFDIFTILLTCSLMLSEHFDELRDLCWVSYFLVHHLIGVYSLHHCFFISFKIYYRSKF